MFLLSDVRLFRDGLASLLSGRLGVRVSGTAPPSDAALSQIAAAQPRVVLMDSSAARIPGLARQVTAAAPLSTVVAFGLGDEAREVIACVEGGVAGFVAREASLDELVQLAGAAGRGDLVCSPRIATMMVRCSAALFRDHAASPVPALTQREQEIVAMIDRAMTNKEIAQALSIELTTVKHHVHHLLEKLGVRRRAEAAAKLRSMD